MTEDYPPGEETIFRSGDRILAVGDTSVRGMSPDDFQELLEVRTLPYSVVYIEQVCYRDTTYMYHIQVHCVLFQ